MAADISVNVSESLEPLSFAGTFSLAINSAGIAVSETVQIGGSTITINLPAGPYVRLTASNAKLQTDVIDVRGNLILETTGSEDSREIRFAMSQITAFLGTDSGTPEDTTDDVGLQFTDGRLLAYVTSDGGVALSTTGPGSFANDVPV
ncbi:MAG: hypothetical protein ACK58J_04825, partial [Planctomyces sp.]